jgi:hypothetical protein
MVSTGALALLASSLAACATVTRGPNTAWNINTYPAGASVQTTTGAGCAATPCSIKVSRRSTFTATLAKPGYKSVNVNVDHRFSSAGGVALLGNALIGGIVGVTIDVATGATDDLAPNDLNMPLERDPSAPLGTVEEAWNTSRSLGGFTMPPPLPPSWAAAKVPAASEPQDGRVVAIRVLPSGGVEEIRDIQ